MRRDCLDSAKCQSWDLNPECLMGPGPVPLLFSGTKEAFLLLQERVAKMGCSRFFAVPIFKHLLRNPEHNPLTCLLRMLAFCL